jgi:hypothetical protein
MMWLSNTGLQESIGKTAYLLPNIKQFYLGINRPEIVSICVSGKVFDAVPAAPAPDPSLYYIPNQLF